MSERPANDAFFTPPALARAIVARLVERDLLRKGQTVWEPHVGSGSFVGPLLHAGVKVLVSDIDLNSDGCGYAGVSAHDVAWDARKGFPWPGRPDWIIGNPPFNQAEEHVRALLPIPRYGLAFVTRQSFTATAKRADLAEQVWQVWPINPRPSFTPDGKTDACEYNVLLYVRGHGLAERPLAPLTWSRS